MTDDENPPTIGEQLREARQGRKLSLEQMATTTRIRLHYLRALESDQFDAFPSRAQARGFMRAYAASLGLDAQRLVGAFDRAGSSQAEIAPLAEISPQEFSSPGVAESIFAQIGLKLKNQREQLGISLADVERYTHLRMHYLQALEAGNIDALPSPVQGKGMLKNYAEFLSLDTEALLLRYAEGLQSHLERKRQSERDAGPDIRPAPPRRRTPSEWVVIGLLATTLAAFSIWGGLRIYETSIAETPVASPPSLAEVLVVTQTPFTTPTASATIQPDGIASLLVPSDVAGEPTISPTVNSAPVQVYLVARQRAWVRVVVDDEVVFEGRIVTGNSYAYSASRRIEILTGNGAGVQVFYNQDDLGVLGSFGEVVERIFSISGVQTPTATITPTPLFVTPSITPTLASTPTP